MTDTPDEVEKILGEVYQRGHKCAAAGYVSEDDKNHAIAEAKPDVTRLILEGSIAELVEAKKWAGKTGEYRTEQQLTDRIAELKAQLEKLG